MLPQDIKNRIRRDFNSDEINSVESLLSEYDGREAERVIRCLLYLSNGSYEKLKLDVESAKLDYRDIIYFAEYDQADRQINDFSKPFASNE